MVFTTSAVGLRSHVDLGRVALAFTAPVTVIHIEPTEPIVALSGVGGHSVHGHEDLWCQSQPFDGGGQIWVADRWG